MLAPEGSRGTPSLLGLPLLSLSIHSQPGRRGPGGVPGHHPVPGASTAVSSPKSCLSSTIRDNAPTKMVAPLLACWPWAREAQVPIWHPQPEGQGDSLAGVSCLRGPEPADPKSSKAGSQRPLGLLNLRHVGASPAPAPCFPHPRVAPAEDRAPQGHLPGARTAPGGQPPSLRDDRG